MSEEKFKILEFDSKEVILTVKTESKENRHVFILNYKIQDNFDPSNFLDNKREILNLAKIINKQFGYTSIKSHLLEIYESKLDNLNSGRDYLMQVEPSEITPSDTLEAFGFGRDGLKYD